MENTMLLALASGLIGSIATIGVQFWLSRIKEKTDSAVPVMVWLDQMLGTVARLEVLQRTIYGARVDLDLFGESERVALQATELLVRSVEQLRVGLIWGEHSREYQLVESIHGACVGALSAINRSTALEELNEATKLLDQAEGMRQELQKLMKRAALPAVQRRLIAGFDE